EAALRHLADSTPDDALLARAVARDADEAASLSEALFQAAIDAETKRRLGPIDDYFDQMSTGAADPAAATALGGLTPEARDKVAALAEEARRLRDRAREDWELKAIIGALSADEAVRLASIDPRSDARTREQHRRMLLDGGAKALGALFAVLAASKLELEKTAVAIATPEAANRLAEITQALAEVGLVMKSAGWEPPASQAPKTDVAPVPIAPTAALKAAPTADAARPARRGGGYERD
ncbi:MAG: hypothetical protein IBJ15_04720, partial [Alphaproteobacteria bacterium]|nr:hypothetical protein [Alphaproteobacteria bacterium]